MKSQDYQNTIITTLPRRETLEKITSVSLWWAKDFEGRTKKQHDVFTVRFKNVDRYTMRVSEVIPDKKIVWDVIDSYQGWNSKPDEWNSTKIIWEIVSKNNKTEVTMTHFGLVPEFACFDACNQGWNYLIRQSLQKLLDSNKGMPV